MVHETCKLAMEQYIRSTYDNYTILRIPRVYDKTRTKGLMRKIREDKISKKDMHRRVEYITINQFLEQTLPLLDTDNIIYDYAIKEKNKIKEIKELFE
jgi:dTDP-4-dehydrorhamnose reductase